MEQGACERKKKKNNRNRTKELLFFVDEILSGHYPQYIDFDLVVLYVQEESVWVTYTLLKCYLSAGMNDLAQT